MAVVHFLVADTTIGAASNGIGVAKILLRNFHACNTLSLIDSYAEQSSSSSPSARALQISSVSSNAVDAVASPPAKSCSCRVPRRTLLRRKRRNKRRLSGDDSENVGDEGFLSGDGGDGPSGGNDGGFGGGGWNYNGFGEGRDGDESSSSHSDPAFDFVYEVLSWIMLSNCLHFAFKKIIRSAADGIVGADRGKVLGKPVPTIWYLLLHRNISF
ncbi:uncharacterized protein LOC114751356 [Neltuma alba]|uniref:uncharacterized protein LOC114751356 n=1 Tax=Neltuma alba TaxID=207710 RepID=UPI0010A4FD5A|nr:uncharacterized protein LOC114751356 [Prosopis alba]